MGLFSLNLQDTDGLTRTFILSFDIQGSSGARLIIYHSLSLGAALLQGGLGGRCLLLKCLSGLLLKGISLVAITGRKMEECELLGSGPPCQRPGLPGR